MEPVEIEQLSEIRKKFPEGLPTAQEAKARELCQKLVTSGYWPSGEDAYIQWLEFGGDWYKWETPRACEHCGSNLLDYDLGPPYKRALGILNNNRLSYFKCPDCDKRLNIL